MRKTREIRKAFCLLLSLTLLLTACSDKKGGDPDPDPASGLVRGADVSWLTEMEAAGRKFYDQSGTATECMTLLKSIGVNSIRLRVWVNPVAGWNNAADVLQKAVRAHNLGLAVLIDFHYSDTWADPGHQTKPAAWASLSFSDLKNALAQHTSDVLQQIKTAGVTPTWVQVGNETNNGLLWPDGQASTNMNNYAQLVNAGYDAVKSVFPAAKVIVHLSDGWDNALFQWNIGGLVSNGARFDVIGMSLYPSFVTGGWQVANQQCLANMNDMVSRYGKEVMVVEVGMPWDDAANCRLFITDLFQKIRSVSNKKGLGILYWEPQSYSAWQGYTLGAFDNFGKPTVAMQAFAP